MLHIKSSVLKTDIITILKIRQIATVVDFFQCKEETKMFQ